MEERELIKVAYVMQAAYIKNRTRGETIKQVKDKIPTANEDILRAMWEAIDAYVDINESNV